MKFIVEFVKTSQIEITADTKTEAQEKAMAVKLEEVENNVIDGWYFNSVEPKESELHENLLGNQERSDNT